MRPPVPFGPIRGQRGVTLMELTVALALFSMIVVGVMSVWQKTQEAYFVGSEAAEVQQNVRSAIDFMVRELRATGRDITVCAFDYATDPVAVCGATKAAACQAKLGGGYTSCAGVYALPATAANSIRIRSDRNDNGQIDLDEEDVTYSVGACATGQCIIRTTTNGASAMVAVDIQGLTFTYYPRPGYPPCSNVPPQNPCPAFATVPATNQDRDNIGRIGISVTALTIIGGQQVARTLTTDVILKNRFSN
jgi:prepilin-type N-terminal cleavage/methylation domain-containing protein